MDTTMVMALPEAMITLLGGIMMTPLSSLIGMGIMEGTPVGITTMVIILDIITGEVRVETQVVVIAQPEKEAQQPME